MYQWSACDCVGGSLRGLPRDIAEAASSVSSGCLRVRAGDRGGYGRSAAAPPPALLDGFAPPHRLAASSFDASSSDPPPPVCRHGAGSSTSRPSAEPPPLSGAQAGSVIGWSARCLTSNSRADNQGEGSHEHSQQAAGCGGSWRRYQEERVPRRRIGRGRPSDLVGDFPERDIAAVFRACRTDGRQHGDVSQRAVAGTQADRDRPHTPDHPCKVREAVREVEQERHH